MHEWETWSLSGQKTDARRIPARWLLWVSFKFTHDEERQGVVKHHLTPPPSQSIIGCPKSLPCPDPGLPGTPSLQGAPRAVTPWQGQEENKAQTLPRIWHLRPAGRTYQKGRRKAALYLAKRQIGSLKKSLLLWKVKTKQNPHPLPPGRPLAVPAYRRCHHLPHSLACPGPGCQGSHCSPSWSRPPDTICEHGPGRKPNGLVILELSTTFWLFRLVSL